MIGDYDYNEKYDWRDYDYNEKIGADYFNSIINTANNGLCR